MLRSLILTLVLATSVFGQTKVREGSQTMGALPTTQGGAPIGGSTGQALRKNSASDYDYSWGSVSITTGNLTAAGTDGFVVTGGTGAVVGSGTSLAQHVADATHNGYLSSTDWSSFSSGAAGGTVTSFSAGTLSPLFTTSVTNSTTTPALSFTLSNAGAHTFFANNTGSSGAPSYTSFIAGTDYWDTTLFTGGLNIGLVPSAVGVPTCLRFLDENGTWTCASGGSSGGAPDDASYLTAKAESGLTSEINLGALSTGLLKGTVSGSVSTISSITDNSSNWDTAFTDRLKWDGGATGLVAATGRTSLGLVIGTNVQAWDADLDTWATLTPSANMQTMIPHTFSQMRTDLGLVIGTNVQAWDTQLDSLAGLSYSGNSLKVVRVNTGETGFELVTPSSGGVTSIATTSPITGGTITTTGTIALDVSVDHAFTAGQGVTITDSGTSNVTDNITITHNSSGTPGASNFGTEFLLKGKSATVADRTMGALTSRWSIATDASRDSYILLQAADASGLTSPTGLYVFTNGSVAAGSSTTKPSTSGVVRAFAYQVTTAPQAGNAGNFLLSDGSQGYLGSSYTLPTSIGTSNQVLQSNGTNYLSRFLRGTTTNDSGAAGEVGQEIESLVASGSAVSLTTATAANITSISLTAGDWDVSGNVNFTETTSTVTARSAGITTTSATVPTDGSEAFCGVQSTVTSETNSITLPIKRVSLSGTTTTYLVAKATFSAGTCAGFGAIVARRVR